MRKILMAALACFVAMGINAQTEEPETKAQKYFRLTKTADEKPTDWKAQLEAGRFLLNKEQGMYNMSQAGKYFERVYHLATDYNKEIPDSVLRETYMMLMTIATDKKNIDKALFYIDEIIHAEKVGAEKGKLFPTDIGSVVNTFLMEHFSDIVDYNFTATVEKDFDDIASGKKQWRKVVDKFYVPFHKNIRLTQQTATVPAAAA